VGKIDAKLGRVQVGRPSVQRLALDPASIDPTGRQPWKPDTLVQAFGRLCATAGVDGFTIHSLRHFAASYLIAGNIDVRTVAGRASLPANGRWNSAPKAHDGLSGLLGRVTSWWRHGASF
jgi:hypothetical protein